MCQYCHVPIALQKEAEWCALGGVCVCVMCVVCTVCDVYGMCGMCECVYVYLVGLFFTNAEAENI